MTSEPVFTATLRGELASKKNGKIIRRSYDGRILGLMENAKVRAVEASLVQQLTALRMAVPGKGIDFGEKSLRLVVVIDKDRSETHVTIQAICDRPKKNSGRRRDVQNELQVVCDALERAGVVLNDNQFAQIEVVRMVNGRMA